MHGVTVQRRPSRLATLASLVAASAMLACAGGPKPAGYEDAMREVRKNSRSAAGVRYRRSIERQIGPAFRQAADRCYLKFPDTRGMTLVYRLDANGKPLETMIYPDDSFGRCVYAGVQGLDLPPPPRPDYWVALRVGAKANLAALQEAP